MRIPVHWPLSLLMVSSVCAAQAPGSQATIDAMAACRKEPAALERLACYDHVLTPEPGLGFQGALVKARYQGNAWTRAMEQEKHRKDNSTTLMLTQRPGERPTVIITTPAIGSLPPRPVLVFSCVDNITRMQVALTHARTENDIPVSLVTEGGAFRSHWFVRENGMLLEASRGLPGIEDIRRLWGAKMLTLDTGADKKMTFNIDGLAQAIVPLRDACHWAEE